MEAYTQKDIYAKRHTRWYIYMIGPIYGGDRHKKRHDGTYTQKKYIHSGNIHDETIGACMMRSVAVFNGVQSCMSSSPPNIHLDRSPAVSFAFSLLISMYPCM